MRRKSFSSIRLSIRRSTRAEDIDTWINVKFCIGFDGTDTIPMRTHGNQSSNCHKTMCYAIVNKRNYLSQTTLVKMTTAKKQTNPLLTIPSGLGRSPTTKKSHRSNTSATNPHDMTQPQRRNMTGLAVKVPSWQLASLKLITEAFHQLSSFRQKDTWAVTWRCHKYIMLSHLFTHLNSQTRKRAHEHSEYRRDHRSTIVYTSNFASNLPLGRTSQR